MISIDIFNFFADIDTELMLFLNGWHNHFWNGFMQLCTVTQTWTLFFIALAFCVWKNYPRKSAFFIFLGIGLVIFLSDKTSVQILRPFFQRMRPGNLDNPISPEIFVYAGHRGGPFGFPSAHAANTFGAAFFILWCIRKRAITLTALIWATLVCYTRIYLGKHYPGDLLFGASVGFFYATAVYFCIKKWIKAYIPKDYIYSRWPLYAFTITLISISCISPFLPADQ